MRKLVTVRKIDDIIPIENADQIVCAILDGWQVVVKKDEFKVGQYVFYFEVDSVLPIKPQYEFLRKGCYVNNGIVEGFRLRTVRLRGQISQGLVLPLEEFNCTVEYFGDRDDYTDHMGLCVSECILGSIGDDYSDYLGVIKWEPPLPAQLAGMVKGNFPSAIMKTEQERANNFSKYIFENWKDYRYEVSMKLDGTSMTVYNIEGDCGVCSRNLDLKIDESNAGNSLVRYYIDSGLKDFMARHGNGLALQGELMGPGIQGNRENLKTNKFYLFNVQNISKRDFVSPQDRMILFNLMIEAGVKIDHVPILHDRVTMVDLGIKDFKELMEFAEGPSITHAIREGLVYKAVNDPSVSFKTISTKFLLKEK